MILKRVYETSKDSKNRIAEIEENLYMAKKGANLSCTIDIDAKKTFQTFKGFGCAVTESSGFVLSFLSEDAQQKIMADCFSSKGNGYVFARTHTKLAGETDSYLQNPSGRGIGPSIEGGKYC